MITLADIRAARERIRGRVVLTPSTRSLAFDDLVPCELHFKFENLPAHRLVQRTGGPLNTAPASEPGGTGQGGG